MTELTARVVKVMRERGMLPSFAAGTVLPLPAVNKVEFYPTFRCNDSCDHCITRSGPDREETLDPEDAATSIENVATFSVVARMRRLYGEGDFRCKPSVQCIELGRRQRPPAKLDDPLKKAYAECLQGKGNVAEWVTHSERIRLNYGRPSVRISGGEFYMWPFRLAGRKLSEDERLRHQSQLVGEIRFRLPDYDTWILTNGRFATSRDRADKVVGHWARNANSLEAGGRTRLCISVDIFHRPPAGGTVEEMLESIWRASHRHGLGAPFLYGISNNRIGYLGRAFEQFRVGVLEPHEIKNASCSTFNPASCMSVDPIDLVCQGGCREVKGFYFEHAGGCLLANNIVISPSGRMVYCCACLGDYGDFVNEPARCLERVVLDPVSIMLRRTETAIPFLETAVELDPTVQVFGAGPHPAVTASTCYQMMTGERIGSAVGRPT